MKSLIILAVFCPLLLSASLASGQSPDWKITAINGQTLNDILKPGPDRDTMVQNVIGPSSDGAVTGTVATQAGGRGTNYGVGGFARTDTAGGGVATNGVGVFGVGIVNSDNAQAWAWNSISSDYPDNRYVQTGVGRAIIGAEYDFATYSPYSSITGVAVTGSAKVQPAGAEGFVVGNLSSNGSGSARWTHGLTVNDATILTSGAAIHIGSSQLAGPGVTGVASYPIESVYIDASGTQRTYSIAVTGAGTTAFRNSAGSGTAGVDVDGPAVIRGTLSASADLAVAGAITTPATLSAGTLVASGAGGTGADISGAAVMRGSATVVGALYAGSTLQAPALPAYASESAAAAAGLVCGMMFRIGSVVNVRVTGC